MSWPVLAGVVAGIVPAWPDLPLLDAGRGQVANEAGGGPRHPAYPKKHPRSATHAALGGETADDAHTILLAVVPDCGGMGANRRCGGGAIAGGGRAAEHRPP